MHFLNNHIRDIIYNIVPKHPEQLFANDLNIRILAHNIMNIPTAPYNNDLNI